MFGSAVNKLGKLERNKKVKEADCIFPFKYKWKTHENCVPTDKGDICATSVNEKTRTLQTYGYCAPKLEKKHSKIGTQKKAPKQIRKLRVVEKIIDSKIKESVKGKTNTKTRKLIRMPKKKSLIS